MNTPKNTIVSMNAFVKYIIKMPMMAKMIMMGINVIADAVLVMPNI
jgi:hypothetical protein